MTEYISIKNWSDDDKPREKLAAHGSEYLSNAELLGILLGNGTRNKSAVDLARDILNLAGNDLNKLAKLTITDLCTVSGIGPAKAITVIAAIELAGRRKPTSNHTHRITSSRMAAEIFQTQLQDKDYEEFWALFLKQNNAVIKKQRISEGGISSTLVDPKKLFKAALDCNATGIILCHNHPSGSLKPSPSDMHLTEKLKEGGKQLEIRVLDHIIISDSGFYSMADEGQM